MSLTPDQSRILEAAFHPEEHGFLSGNPYIRKSAIRHRLSLVDPAWSSTRPEFVTRDGDVVIYAGALIVGNVLRHDAGTGIVVSTRKVQETAADGKKIERIVPLEGFELARSISKAHKQAASDVLPRAALQFGIGQYLKDKPKGIGESNFNDWLAKLPQLERPHWGANGARERVNDVMKGLGLTWAAVAGQAEPGRTLAKLTDSTLTEAQFILRLMDIARQSHAPADASH